MSSKKKGEIDQIKLINKYENIKSDYFLRLLFNNLKKKKLLDIVKYNNNLQIRLNIDFNDYKEHSEKYSPIEIEIKAKYNKNDFSNRFINIKQEDEIYYHIYFNNNKKEIKRHYIEKNEKIKIIKIIIDY